MLKKLALAVATLTFLLTAARIHDVPQPTCGPCPPDSHLVATR